MDLLNVYSRLENKVEGELEREGRVGDDNLLPVLEAKLGEGLGEVGPGPLLQAGGELHVESLPLGPDRGLLKLRLGPHGEGVQEGLEGGVWVDLEGPGLLAANGAVRLLLVLEGVGVDAVVARVHHVVVLEPQAGRGGRGELEGLVAARGGDDGVGGGNGGDDILDSALGERVGDPRNVELLGAGEGLLVEPGNVLRVVLVELGEGLLLVPGDDVGPLDAVLRLPRDGGDGAERHGGPGRVHVQLALDA